jgi:hypothetical protein
MDMFTELYRLGQESYDSRLSRAQISAYAVAREKFLPFLKQAKTQEDADLRLDLGDSVLVSLAKAAAEKHGVEYGPVLSHITERLAAEVAVTKPKTVKPDAPIGGAEGKKYLETRPRKVPEEGLPDDRSDVNELDAVVEEPKRHKQVEVDLNSDTQKDNKPGSGSGASGKSFPAHSSVKKEAMPRTEDGWEEDDSFTADEWHESFGDQAYDNPEEGMEAYNMVADKRMMERANQLDQDIAAFVAEGNEEAAAAAALEAWQLRSRIG